MQAVFRYPIDMIEAMSKSGFTWSMPEDARVVSFGYQQERNSYSLWAIVDTEHPLKIRTFYVVATGRQIPENAEYLHSTIQSDELLVFHLFERKS